jgi:hypothetical protein
LDTNTPAGRQSDTAIVVNAEYRGREAVRYNLRRK